jgi:cytochrome c2
MSSSFALDMSEELEFTLGGKKHSLTIKQMIKNFKVYKYTVKSPYADKLLTFEGIRLLDVFDFFKYKPKSNHKIEFECDDGYTPSRSFKTVKELDLIIAFRQVNAKNGDWDLIPQGKSKVTPGPFWLNQKKKVKNKKVSWPYQVVHIRSIDLKKKFPLIYPKDLDPESIQAKGFDLFQTHCMTCHSVNLQGGEIGPELNIPQNITEYRTDKFLKAFIKNPNDFRANSRMSDFKKLKDSEIERIIAYLKEMKNNKRLEQIEKD